MKKFLFVALAAIAVFSNCSKDESDDLPGYSATTGFASATINGEEKDVKWVQLWGNSPKFAEYNVGATSATEYGGYYCWGNTDEQSSNWTGAYKEGNLPLSADDTATNLWGGNWRMPTDAELQGLIDNCDVEIVKDPDAEYKILGRKFKGKGDYSSNSIFLPAAGYCTSNGIRSHGSNGYYWTSSPDGRYYSLRLLFNSTSQYIGNFSRYNGCSVRAVLNEAK